MAVLLVFSLVTVALVAMVETAAQQESVATVAVETKHLPVTVAMVETAAMVEPVGLAAMVATHLLV